MDIAGTMAVVAGGIEAAKGLYAVKQLSENTDLHLQLATVVRSLTAAEFGLNDAQRELREMLSEIARLKAALEIKATVKKERNAYYEVDENGEPHGEPYCMRCYEVDHLLRHVARPSHSSEEGQCPACKTKYPGRTIMVLA
ncbi:hypothetical protein [Pseudoxanthomonas indica]|uniref:Uncharacterized protein n=1 Tax=Pseudoxanthomonas indica TaxID=428993 RepID=A0A1T5LVF2_9GAMM|nr:hypothetical protein [Pseudoxanthomonas indica]GGD39645.1 hypothetical protein GCM10007235_09650 [Pseudoxanthomonas indica]SKC79589.1 hypothetical protein SAMN06296058_3092 [Pseudoxanthomonas indica]